MLGNIFKKSVISFLSVSHKILSLPTRNTFILKRRTPPPLHRKGSRSHRLRSRNFIYELVENTDGKKRDPLNIILTNYVEGLGDRGHRIQMAAFKAYDRLLLPGLAVYDTPENAKKYGVDDSNKQQLKYSSPYVSRTLDILSRIILNVVMSNDNPWILEPWHVRSQFRKAGLYVAEECITMPKHVISGPNHDIENKEFYIIITINRNEKTYVRCRIHHHSNNINKRKQIPVALDFWKSMSTPIFSEDKEILDSLPIPYLVEREMKKSMINDIESEIVST